MILDGNPRSGGRDLALHLMKPENERVEIVEMRGFASDNLRDAFIESFAISKGTRCKQHLFSMSINPPQNAEIGDEDYRHVADLTEDKLGLAGQPRAIVRHWKRDEDGVMRAHAHAVWCRIDVGNMKAVALPFHKLKLRDISRDLHIEYGLKLPAGLVNSKHRDPRNFSLAEWQQCKRAKRNVHEVKDDFKDAWAISDSATSFAHALEERGFFLAKGKRGHVAVDHKGEKFAVSRYVGIKAKDVRAKLGEADNFPTIEEAQLRAARQVTKRLAELRVEQRQQISKSRNFERTREKRASAKASFEESQLRERQQRQFAFEEEIRRSRLRKGLPGFWDWLTGKKKKTLAQNRLEQFKDREKQRQEQLELRNKQLSVKRLLHEQARLERAKHFEALKELRGDMRDLSRSPEPQPEKTTTRKPPSKRPRRRSRSRDGPSLD